MIDFITLLNFIVPIALILGGLICGFFFEQRGLAKLKQIARRTGWQSYEIIINSLRGLILLWFVLAGLFGASLTLPINPALLLILHKILLATFLASITIVVARLAVVSVKLYSERRGVSNLTSLFETLTRLLIYSLGLLIILQSLGIAVTPLLTALGVGGVSIGLALQNTLSNLFSGLNIIMSKQVRTGDYIKLENGEEGYVTDVAWRYTLIREFTDNLLVIPNAKLVSSTFKNYALPAKEMLVPIEVGVSYDSDLEKVETVTLDVAKEVMKKVAGGVPEYDPFIRYNKFDYFSINFTVYLRVKEFIDHLIVRHEFIKMLHKQYQAEGIEIPFPIKSAYVSDKNLEHDSRNWKLN